MEKVSSETVAVGSTSNKPKLIRKSYTGNATNSSSNGSSDSNAHNTNNNNSNTHHDNVLSLTIEEYGATDIDKELLGDTAPLEHHQSTTERSAQLKSTNNNNTRSSSARKSSGTSRSDQSRSTKSSQQQQQQASNQSQKGVSSSTSKASNSSSANVSNGSNGSRSVASNSNSGTNSNANNTNGTTAAFIKSENLNENTREQNGASASPSNEAKIAMISNNDAKEKSNVDVGSGIEAMAECENKNGSENANGADMVESKSEPLPLVSTDSGEKVNSDLNNVDKEHDETAGGASANGDCKSDAKSQQVSGEDLTNRVLSVTNLSSKTRAADLKLVFSKLTKVESVKIVCKSRPGSASKYHGYVVLHTSEDLAKCIEQVHKSILDECVIDVEQCRDVSKLQPSSSKPQSSDDNSKTAKKRSKSPESKVIKIRKISPLRESKSRSTDRSTDRSRPLPTRPQHQNSYIQEARYRERIRRERMMREERERERRRAEHLRMLEKRQREEAEKLAQERERLKIERERLEREKIETERMRIYHERLEQERIQREYMEKKRIDEYRMREEEALRRDKRSYGDKRSPNNRRTQRDTYYHDDNSRYANEASSPMRYHDREHRDRDRSNLARSEQVKGGNYGPQKYGERRASPGDVRMKSRYDETMGMSHQQSGGGVNRRANDDRNRFSGNLASQGGRDQVRNANSGDNNKRMHGGSLQSGSSSSRENSNRTQRRSSERQDSGFRERGKQQDHRNVVVANRMDGNRDNGQRSDGSGNGSNSAIGNREQWVTPPRHTQHSMWPANDAKNRTNEQFNSLARANPIQNLPLTAAALINPLLAQFTANSQAANLGLLGVGPITRQPDVRYDAYYNAPQTNQNQNARRYN